MSTYKFSSKEDNIFQDYYDFISQQIVKGEKKNVDLNRTKNQLNIIEENLEKYFFKTSNFWETKFYKVLFITLKKFLVCFQIRSFEYDVLFISFTKYLEYLIFLSKYSTRVASEDEQIENFKQIIPLSEFAPEIDPILEFEIYPPKDYQSINKFEIVLGKRMGVEKDYSENKILTRDDKEGVTLFCDNYTARKVFWDNKKYSIIFSEIIYYMTLDLIYDKDKKIIEKPEDFALSLYLLTSGIKSIDNILFDIIQIKKSSIWLKIRLWMYDKLSKEEIKTLLSKSRTEIIEYYENERLDELRNARRKIQRIEKEEFDLENQLEAFLSKEQQNQLLVNRIEKEKLENEALRLKNLKSSLEIAASAVELVKSGIVTPESLDFLINSQTFLTKKSDKISNTNFDIEEIT